MQDDITLMNILHATVTSALVVVVSFTSFIGRRFVAKVDCTAEALAQHEKDDIGKYATMDQLQRVHSRIDDSIKTAEDNFRELRKAASDIKDLLINGVHR